LTRAILSLVCSCSPATHHLYPLSLHDALPISSQAADVAAQNIKDLVEGNKTLTAFEPNILGTVASLGNNDAIGTIFGDKKIFGWNATVMKKIIDNKHLLKLGGIGLLLKKGKFNIFNS